MLFFGIHLFHRSRYFNSSSENKENKENKADGEQLFIEDKRTADEILHCLVDHRLPARNNGSNEPAAKKQKTVRKTECFVDNEYSFQSGTSTTANDDDEPEYAMEPEKKFVFGNLDRDLVRTQWCNFVRRIWQVAVQGILHGQRKGFQWNPRSVCDADFVLETSDGSRVVLHFTEDEREKLIYNGVLNEFPDMLLRHLFPVDFEILPRVRQALFDILNNQHVKRRSFLKHGPERKAKKAAAKRLALEDIRNAIDYENVKPTARC